VKIIFLNITSVLSDVISVSSDVILNISLPKPYDVILRVELCDPTYFLLRTVWHHLGAKWRPPTFP